MASRHLSAGRSSSPAGSEDKENLWAAPAASAGADSCHSEGTPGASVAISSTSGDSATPASLARLEGCAPAVATGMLWPPMCRSQAGSGLRA